MSGLFAADDEWMFISDYFFSKEILIRSKKLFLVILYLLLTGK